MKLAEALIQRADAQKRLDELRRRLARSARVQEGEQPPENPQELLLEANQIILGLTKLIQQINYTNANSRFDADRSLTDVLAERDMLAKRRDVLDVLIESATQSQTRYGRSEIKFYSTINIAEIQKQLDDLARDYRQIDTAIQALNWQLDLIEKA